MTCLKVWKGYYDTVKALGEYLRGSRHAPDGKEPAYTLSFSERHAIEKEIDEMKRCSNSYLDSVGLKKSSPLWVYTLTDQRTWVSSDTFKYRNLI
jgi:hypothetical protein